MKSKLMFGIMTCVMSMAVWSACEKMQLGETDDDGVAVAEGNVVLTVSQFEQMPFETKTRADAAANCSRLCFHIYDDSHKRISYVNEKLDDKNFGTASFSLDEGHYYLVVVGHSASSNPSFSADERVSISGKNLGDTFWCMEELTVGKDKNERIEKSLVLRRIVSMVSFLPDDDRPETLNQLIFSYKGSRGTFNGLTGYGSTSASQTVTLTLEEDESEYAFYMIPSSERDTINVTVTASYIDDEGTIHILSKKTIEGIPVKRNCVTICRGKLFDNKNSTGTSSFVVSVEDSWEDNLLMRF